MAFDILTAGRIINVRHLARCMKPILLFLLVVATVAAIAQGITHRLAPTVSVDVPTKRKLVEKAVVLKAGDSFQTVTNALGKPTADTTHTTRPDPQTGSFRQTGRFLEYHMQIWEGAHGEDAEFVKISLDEDARVQWVVIRAKLR